MKKILFVLLVVSLAFANIKFWDGDNLESRGLDGVTDSVGYKINEIG